MPPSPARNFFVILFDMKTQSRAYALKTLSTILLHKRLSRAKDDYKLYLVNAARSNNNLPDGMFNLNKDIDVENLLTELETIETGNCDWLEALKVAMGDLKEWFEMPGIISLQVLFITDLSSFERPNNGNLLGSVVADIQNYDIFLYVVGPDIEPPNIITSGEDIKDWMQLLQVDKTNSNLKVMKKIITQTPHSVICSYDVGVHLFHSYLYKKGMQPWHVPLTFGTILELSLSTVRITKQEAPFKLKRTNKMTYTFKWVYEDQEDVEFVDQAISGIVKHEKFVKIETDGMFKIEGPRSFRVLGFTSAENIPEYLLQSDGSYLVVPKENMTLEELEFCSVLVDELEKSNKYIIARRVYNKNFNPKFVALIPNSQFKTKCFTLCELPYADDIAHDYKENLCTVPRAEKIPDAFAFLDSINTSGGTIKVPLAPSMMVDTSSLNIIRKVEEKKNISEKLEEKFGRFQADINNYTDNLKTSWPIRELLKAKKEENTADDFDEIGDFDFS